MGLLDGSCLICKSLFETCGKWAFHCARWPRRFWACLFPFLCLSCAAPAPVGPFSGRCRNSFVSLWKASSMDHLRCRKSTIVPHIGDVRARVQGCDCAQGQCGVWLRKAHAGNLLIQRLGIQQGTAWHRASALRTLVECDAASLL